MHNELLSFISLTHWGQVTCICVSNLGHHWFILWLVTWLVPIHYLNRCWGVVNWTLKNKLQWNFNQSPYIFIQENAFENVVWKMAAILSLPQCVKEFLKNCYNIETTWQSAAVSGIACSRWGSVTYICAAATRLCRWQRGFVLLRRMQSSQHEYIGK